MVRSYFRHGPSQAFGVICSPTANCHFDGRLAFVAGWEDVLVWDVKRGEMVSMWHSPSHTSPVTFLAPSPSADETRTFAVAYTDGSIRLWAFDPTAPSSSTSLIEPVEIITLNGHKSSITHMTFDGSGSRLASGGTAGEIVIWDVLAETGLYRLKGHRGPITGLAFVPHPHEGHPGYLISCSKDTYLKLWDLSTQHCVQTVVVGRGEVGCMAVREEEGQWVVMTGSGDGEVKIWGVEAARLAEGLKEDRGQVPTFIEPRSSLPLSPTGQPISQIAFHNTAPLLLVQTTDRTVTAFRLRTEEEVAAKRARRKKRDRVKGKSKDEIEGAAEDVAHAEEDGVEPGAVGWGERAALLCVIRGGSKIKSFSISADHDRRVQVLLALSNNSLESHVLPSLSSKSSVSSEATRTHTIELPGHRNDPRAVALSSDDQVIASAANGSLKIWNAKTTACLRTMECGYALCLTFLPGDRHVVVGIKTGELLLYDIAASSLLQSYQAHKGAVWAIHVRPDGRGMASGSADKDIKFWEFEVKEVEGETIVNRLGNETTLKTRQLSLVHVRTLKMTDDVLAVKYSPDGRFIAVALLDSTVKIFFEDSLKFFLSLYGHKLPVLSLDISADSKLIATCSADKNVKLWGMDFGDCHRSIFAHDDSIMCVAFERVAGSHNFWTAGKDRMLKYWDGDKFELIQALSGHQAEIWSVHPSASGTFLVSVSHDKSLRVWEKTDEPLFLSEERERELELSLDSSVTAALNEPVRRIGSGVDADAEADDGMDVEGVRKATSETLMAGEKIMEALEMEDDAAEIGARGGEKSQYVYEVVRKVPAASMEDALVVLPFSAVAGLLGHLDAWAVRSLDPILISRILLFLLRTHSSQLTATSSLRPLLFDLRKHLQAALGRQREMMGYNLAGLRFLKSRWESERIADMGVEEVDVEEVRAGLGVTKRKRVGVRV